MSAAISPRRSVLRRLLPAIAMLALAGCSRVPDHLSWTEEVQLSDGRTIVVSRTEYLRDDTTLGGPGEVSRTRVELRAHEPADAFPEWSAPAMVQLLDVDPATGEWILVVIAYTCESWDLIGRPSSARVM